MTSSAKAKKDLEFQKFLDSKQYARKGIQLYEKIFGPTFVSTGGEATTKQFFNELSSPWLKVGNNRNTPSQIVIPTEYFVLCGAACIRQNFANAQRRTYFYEVNFFVMLRVMST